MKLMSDAVFSLLQDQLTQLRDENRLLRDRLLATTVYGPRAGLSSSASPLEGAPLVGEVAVFPGPVEAAIEAVAGEDRDMRAHLETFATRALAVRSAEVVAKEIRQGSQLNL